MANIDAMKILGSLLNSGALSRGSASNILGSVIGAVTGAGQTSGSAPTRGGGGGLGDLVEPGLAIFLAIGAVAQDRAKARARDLGKAWSGTGSGAGGK